MAQMRDSKALVEQLRLATIQVLDVAIQLAVEADAQAAGAPATEEVPRRLIDACGGDEVTARRILTVLERATASRRPAALDPQEDRPEEPRRVRVRFRDDA